MLAVDWFEYMKTKQLLSIHKSCVLHSEKSKCFSSDWSHLGASLQQEATFSFSHSTKHRRDEKRARLEILPLFFFFFATSSSITNSWKIDCSVRAWARRRREPSTEGLCWSSFERIVVSYFSGRRERPSARAYRCSSAPLHVYLSRCLDLSTDPLVVVYKIPAWDKVARTVCSATSRLLNDRFISCALALVKRRRRRRRKTSLNSLPRSTAFHSNSCWYLLFLWW